MKKKKKWVTPEIKEEEISPSPVFTSCTKNPGQTDCYPPSAS